jgi:nucleotide-binding universal stress UspA family protein
MYRRILVPLDGSLLAEEAVPVAADLARRSGASLELALVHVSMAAALAAAPVAVDFQELERLQLEDEAAYLRRVTERVHDRHGLAVDTRHLTGPVVDALAAHIRDAKVDLVVITTHGRGAVGRMWLGSVADGLIRTATAPVLVLRSTDAARRGGFRRVLIPLDQSEAAHEAVAAARKLVDDEGECLLMTVIDPSPLMNVAPVPFGLIPELVVNGEMKERAQLYLDRIARAIRRTGVRARAAVRVAANPAVEILDEAAQERVDAIVVTTHGVGGMRRLLLGSVVDKLVRGAEVPVLVCRPSPARRTLPARRPMRVHQGT